MANFVLDRLSGLSALQICAVVGFCWVLLLALWGFVKSRISSALGNLLTFAIPWMVMALLASIPFVAGAIGWAIGGPWLGIAVFLVPIGYGAYLRRKARVRLGLIPDDFSPLEREDEEDLNSEQVPYVPPLFVPPAAERVGAVVLFGRAMAVRLGLGAAFAAETVERLTWNLQKLVDEGRLPLRSAIESVERAAARMAENGGPALAAPSYVGGEAASRLAAILSRAESEARPRDLSPKRLLDAYAVLVECETSGRALPPLSEALPRVSAMIERMSAS